MTNTHLIMKAEEVDVMVRFEIIKQYELKTEVALAKKDGIVAEKRNLPIDCQSIM